MSAQQLGFNARSRSDNTSGLGVLFFLLGAPHIYSFLRQRSNRKPAFWTPKQAGWLISLLAGILVLLVV